MNIIEKLGITPGPWELEERSIYNHYKRLIVDIPFLPNDDEALRNMNLITAAPEMLEALIEVVKLEIEMEASGDCGSWEVFENEPVKTIIPIIEKATGKSWEEIKEL